MKIRVKLFANLRIALGFSSKDFEVEGPCTVRRFLEILAEEHPGAKKEILDERGRLREYLNVLLNGRNLRDIGGEDAQIEDNDLLAIFPPVAGG